MSDDAALVAHHLKECTGAEAAVVVDGNADETIAGLLAAGWLLVNRVDVIAGKRIRFLIAPPPGHSCP